MRVAAPLAAVTIAASGLTVLAQAQASAAAPTITLVSVSSTGDQGNGFSFERPALSSDGRYVAFSSEASNLVPGDPSAESDVFLRDTLAGMTEMVSVSSVGEPGNGRSILPDISADGRFVVFESSASNLAPGDLNGATDVFVRDRQTGATSLASVSTTGELGNGASEHAVVSADGRYVAFSSQATNLVDGDTNAVSDIFVRDLSAGTTTRVSVSSSGTQANGGFNLWPSLSASGDKVAFGSGATNLDPLDTNGRGDVYVHDRISGITSVASVSSAGELSNGFSFHAALSGDGNAVAFTSSGTNLVPEDTNGVQDIFVRDLVAGTTERVSVTSNEKEGTDYSEVPDISGDGRFIAFYSPAVLTPKDGNLTVDVFLRDRLRGTTSRISTAPKGKDANGGSDSPAINGLGTRVSFESVASNLVPNDVNDAGDIFLYRSGS
jgi:Tol biopolymer transport system component